MYMNFTEVLIHYSSVSSVFGFMVFQYKSHNAISFFPYRAVDRRQFSKYIFGPKKWELQEVAPKITLRKPIL